MKKMLLYFCYLSRFIYSYSICFSAVPPANLSCSVCSDAERVAMRSCPVSRAAEGLEGASEPVGGCL